MQPDLQRFEAAHHQSFSRALGEVKNGKKLSHWMWYIFPQIKGLGLSETSMQYAIKNIQEAEAFLAHPVLGKNLATISAALLQLPGNNATKVFGKPDDLKLRSSMTLFANASNADPVFQQVLDKYFNGQPDGNTLLLLESNRQG